MRFRRATAETAPPSGAEAVFVGVLDGRRLWVAVDARPGRIALRAGSGDLLDLVDELAGDPDAPTGHLAARLDLAALPAAAATYDVVVVGPDERVTPVSTGALDARRVPVAPGGRVRHRLERSADAGLRLRTEVVQPALELGSVSVGPDGVTLTIDGPDGPLTLDADELLTDVGPEATPVLVGPDRLPVRRRDDDLADPGRGAPLPPVGRVRLRWSAEGLLRARLVEGDET